MSGTADVRVRFAPSPTGYLHVGGARTAIFNWLFARRHGGAFVLRIEDTDVERSSRESEQSLLDDLRWLGLDWDEGPVVGGSYGPYRQSERLELYRAAADDFIARGLAYPCFCTDEMLEEKRRAALARGVNPQYDGTCRHLSAEEVERRRDAGQTAAVRFRVPVDIVAFDDIVRGGMDLDTHMVGDFVIVRSNGLPTYNFAAAHDDHRMNISHVVRGEEHLSNTLRQMLIYHAMAADPPVFAHVPLILAEDRSKLSKRHGAASVDDLRDRGFLPAAVRNYLALLGWSHPDEKELLPVDELIAAFDIKRINKSAAIFDSRKLAWMNGQHIRMLGADELYAIAEPYLPDWLGDRYDESQRREIVALLHDHIDTLADLEEQCEIFRDDVTPDAEAAETLASDSAGEVLRALAAALDEAADPLTADAFKAMVKDAGKSVGVKGKDLFFPVRAALTGSTHGPDLARIAGIKGRPAVLNALRRHC
jgi:nondiscriminating glutamyl-tRNA synthetase